MVKADAGRDMDMDMQDASQVVQCSLAPGGCTAHNLSRLMRPQFSIITPSFRQLDWLKLCAASIADQTGATVEHIVQDAGTGPELEACPHCFAWKIRRI